MKILLLGAGGMIGNGVYKIFSELGLHFIATVSQDTRGMELRSGQVEQFTIQNHPLQDATYLIQKFRPTHVVNCIGMIKPSDDLKTIKKLYNINSVFPQVLARVCDTSGARLIHMSTDCVFSGKRGNYTETDIPDDDSDYGKSKYLGEVTRRPHVTIRTSVIGRELHSQKNLLDWFLAVQDKQVSGYSSALWNGVTSLCIGRVIARIIIDNLHFDAPVLQITGDTLSKYELLRLFQRVFGKDVHIVKKADYVSDKTLVPYTKQFAVFGDIIPPIADQIRELKKYY